MAENNYLLGYDNTNYIPGSMYRVHDSQRPQPRQVSPGSTSTPEQPALAPGDATVLFGGKDLSNWVDKDGNAAGWKVENDYMEVFPGSGNIRSLQEFGDCQLHVEWSSPADVESHSQGRGNSGVFIMGLYEIQVLDSYDNPTYADGHAGAVYGQFPPLVNVCRPPGEWQTFDIIWLAPRFEKNSLIRPAYVTVIHNGVLIHHRQQLLGPTTHRKTPCYTPHSHKGPLELQDHNNKVRFRNIWYRPVNDYDE